MKLIFPLGLVALLVAGQVNARPSWCSDLPDRPVNNEDAFLVSEAAKPNISAPEWQAEQVYQKGDVVMFGEELYQARWWTQFEAPGPAWTSWERIKQDNAPWQQDLVYEQNNTVLFDGHIFQAQYWNQGNSPAESGAWQLEQQSEKLLASELVISGYQCLSPLEWCAELASEEESHRALWMKPEITDQILYDYVIIEHGDKVTTVPFEAVVEGQVCQGQVACNNLLDGQAKFVEYRTGYSYTYRIIHGDCGPAPTPLPTIEPTPPMVEIKQDVLTADESKSSAKTDVQVVVKYCNQDHLCRPIVID